MSSVVFEWFEMMFYHKEFQSVQVLHGVKPLTQPHASFFLCRVHNTSRISALISRKLVVDRSQINSYIVNKLTTTNMIHPTLEQMYHDLLVS